MSFWTGRKEDGGISRARDKMLSFGARERILDLQDELLTAGGKKVFLWLRRWTGEFCVCNKQGQVISPHSICWGTGLVGGYRKYGFIDWIIYKKTDLKYGVITPILDYEVSMVNNQVTTNWINGTGFIGDVTKNVLRRDIQVQYTVDDLIWSDNLTLPQTQFKIRININDDFEIIRVRGAKINHKDYILMSEVPPRRLMELQPSGLKDLVADIRGWTLSSPYLSTGDVIEWREGSWKNKRYTIVDRKVSQLKINENESSTVSQILGMRQLEQFHQIGRIW